MFRGKNKKEEKKSMYVREDMQFIGIKDFYIKSEYVKLMYQCLPLHEKWEYKYYVYARPFLKDYFKDIIWEYLNEEQGSIFYKDRIALYNISRKSRI